MIKFNKILDYNVKNVKKDIYYKIIIVYLVTFQTVFNMILLINVKNVKMDFI